jgi:signal-transduction protein with cAMP-binding, CBS, and nucleotidyltransferase domain
MPRHSGPPTLNYRRSRALRADGVGAIEITAVVATVMRDLTARAATLAVAAMRADGKGGAPADWCVLVLGSGGRGESLLAPDQDNALVHDGGPDVDAWFAGFGAKLNALLAEAGVPLCQSNVMVGNPSFRRSIHGWKDEIDRWARIPAGQSLLNVDIFWDFAAVAGDPALAASVRAYATKTARKALPLLRQLAQEIEGIEAPLDLLGRFRARGGRVDLKRHGLFPIVAGARVMALAAGIEATATDRRLLDVATLGRIDGDQARVLVAARADLAAAILDQQLADLYAGKQPGNAVDPKSWSKARRATIKSALRAASRAHLLVRDVLTGAGG